MAFVVGNEVRYRNFQNSKVGHNVANGFVMAVEDGWYWIKPWHDGPWLAVEDEDVLGLRDDAAECTCLRLPVRCAAHA